MHKKACKKRAAELHDEALFKEPPPREDCPICFLPLPFGSNDRKFHSCCGKLICNGCIYAMWVNDGDELCPFCRAPTPTTNAETFKRLKKLVEAKNAYAFFVLGGYYATGDGVPHDIEKSNELWLKAGQLGCSDAYHNLGVAYNNGRGVEIDKKKAKHYYELAAMNGCVRARHNLGCMEGRTGNDHRAYKHCMLAAKAGHKESLDKAKQGFMDGYVTKDEYANTLRAYQKIQDEMKSDDRDKAEEFYQHIENVAT